MSFDDIVYMFKVHKRNEYELQQQKIKSGYNFFFVVVVVSVCLVHVVKFSSFC